MTENRFLIAEIIVEAFQSLQGYIEVDVDRNENLTYLNKTDFQLHVYPKVLPKVHPSHPIPSLAPPTHGQM